MATDRPPRDAVDCREGIADIEDVLTLLAYWVTILKLQHQRV